MIEFNLINFLIYFGVAWGSNIALNFLYVAKKYIPKVNQIDHPIDFKLTYRNNRLIGDSITVIGLIISILLGLLLYIIQLNFIWSLIPIIVYFGGLIGSFIKRRFNKKQGDFLPLIDHGDYMIVLGIAFVLSGYISINFALLALGITYILHPIACLLAFKLNWRKNPY